MRALSVLDVGLIIGQADHEQGGAPDASRECPEINHELLGSHCEGDFAGGDPRISVSTPDRDKTICEHGDDKGYEQCGDRRVDVVVKDDALHLSEIPGGRQNLAGSNCITEPFGMGEEADRRVFVKELLPSRRQRAHKHPCRWQCRHPSITLALHLEEHNCA